MPKALGAGGSSDAFDWTIVPPEEVGMSVAGLEKIRAAIQESIDNKSIPGAVTALARHNKLVWYEAQGLSDVEAGTPMPKDGIFRMMSSTKVITAVAVLMMLDEGKLSVDDPVSRFLPTFKDQKVAVPKPEASNLLNVELVPAARDITIKDLLTHTSGLGSGGAGANANKFERKPDDTLADFIPQLGAAALDFEPGSKFAYSPIDGFDVLLRIVEMTSGQPADKFLEERLFRPLDMNDTYFNVPEDKQERIVALYGKTFWTQTWKVEEPLLGNGPSTYLYGCGGLFSTVHDYMQFELMLLNHGSLNGRRILKSETVDLMARNHVGSLFAEWIPIVTAGNGFGLGVRVVEDEERGGGRSEGAFGWGGAYGTETWADPKLDVAAAFFIHVSSPPHNVRSAFEEAIRGAVVAG
jgi:CubicO group peptidase (beta-lactamase class C family)